MDNKKVNWEIIYKKDIKNLSAKGIIDIVLKNRGIARPKDRKEFLNPIHPEKLALDKLKINKKEVISCIKRLKKAYKNKEKVIVYGDYDADGISGTAVLWESLFSLGFDVLPYIPERFSEGYGINFESVKNIKNKYPNLGIVITVDNGIVATKEIEKIKKLKVDVIVTDHHDRGDCKLNCFSIIHTTKISGSAVAWILAREILKSFPGKKGKYDINAGLDLVAIGTIADQVSLVKENRSFVKWGLIYLNETKRFGLISMFKEAGLTRGEIGTYEVGFIIAPRINATGRIEHGIDSLRILCTKNVNRADKLANIIGKTNQKRQNVLDEVVKHAKTLIDKKNTEKVLILVHESYHEGVIGLAASKLVEEFYRPAIVISKGRKISKASARSIYGFNIIENIRKLDGLLEDGGGHPMAAGFSILNSNIKNFKSKFQKIANDLLTDDLLEKKIRVDMKLSFKEINFDLIDNILKLEPFGIGNPYPTFLTEEVNIEEVKAVGKEKKHLKILLKNSDILMEAIAFNQARKNTETLKNKKVAIIYSLEKNIWDGREKIQLKIRDFK